jgi:hypothetical protein
MLFQFTVVEDNSIWVCDVQFLQWGRVSSPAKDAESKVLESGKLVPKGFGIYGLEPRTPPGLATIGTYMVGLGNTIKIYIRANVEIKDFTMPAPIRQILYEILPSDPKQVEQSIQEMTDAQGSEAAEPQGSSESEVSGSLPETTARTEQPQAETGVELGNGQVG